MASENLPALFRATCDRLGPRAAVRFRRDGLYRDLSWDDYRRRVDEAAAGLVALGVKPGDRVAILSENRVEWLEADLAVLSAGAVGVPLHAPLSAGQVAYQVAHSGAVGAIVSGPGQAAKVLEARDQAPELRWIVAFDAIGAGDPGIRALSWLGLGGEGRRAGPAARLDVDRRISALSRGDLASILYTSGTTGPPKGVMLSHGNFLSNAETTAVISGSVPTDVVLSWLPYSHVYARTCDLYVFLVDGATLALAESVDALMVHLAEVQPSCMSSVPRFYEKVWGNLQGVPEAARPRALWGIFGPNVRHFSSGAPRCRGRWPRGSTPAG